MLDGSDSHRYVIRQRRLALSAHAHSTLAKGAHHHRAGLGRKSRHGCEHSGSAAAGATVPVRCLDHRHGGNRSAGTAQAQGVGDHDDAGGGHDGRVDTVAARTYREEGKAISVAETMNGLFLFG